MTRYERLKQQLSKHPKTWLITGVAGFIGSNLLEALLKIDQKVIGLDNFTTGHLRNLEEVEKSVSRKQWANFQFIQGDIRNLETCHLACRSIDYVLHQAALGSVPRSLKDPITTNNVNIDGFLNMLVAARDAQVKRFIYAASSSTYGDHPGLPKVEETIGKPLSPYAITKYVNEIYAETFFKAYALNSVGLRYFNVFGKRQDPDGAYAAVIPNWTTAMLKGEDIFVNGDGETSRDFCHIENVIQANLLASCIPSDFLIYNVAVGGRTTLNQLFQIIRKSLDEHGISYTKEPIYKEFRAADVRHSQADISRIKNALGYSKIYDLPSGIRQSMDWYIRRFTSHN